MRPFTLGFAVSALVLTATLAAADTQHVTRSFDLAPGGTLKLNSFSGHVRITASDSPRATINAVRYGTREQLDAIALDIRQDGSTIVVDANRREHAWWSWWGHSDVVDTDFDISVPRRTDLDIHVFSSDVDVNGVDGTHRVKAFSAPVRLDAVAGSVNVHTFSGRVTLRARDWVEAESIVVDTFSGGVELHVPAQARGSAEFRSFSGHLTASMPLTLNSSSRRATRAQLDGTGPSGQIRVKTFSGDLRLDR